MPWIITSANIQVLKSTNISLGIPELYADTENLQSLFIVKLIGNNEMASLKSLQFPF